MRHSVLLLSKSQTPFPRAEWFSLAAKIFPLRQVGAAICLVYLFALSPLSVFAIKRHRHKDDFAAAKQRQRKASVVRSHYTEI